MTQPLTIVQLVPQLNTGGVERGTLEVSRALVAAGHRSLVISGGGQLVAQLEAEGGEHVEMQVWKKSPLTLMSVRRLRRWMRDMQPDIVHVRSRVPAWVTWLALKKMPPNARPRFVTTVHGLNRPSAYSRVMTYGERVIAVSNTVFNYLRQTYPDVDPKKITVVCRGVDPQEFPYGYAPSDAWLQKWHEQYPQLKGQFVACVAGRVTRLKGHFDFLAALRILADRGHKVFGVIAGGEDPRRQTYATELRAKVRELSLEDQVIFTGHRSDIRDVIVACDAIISTTAEPPESFGRAVLESVRLGKVTLGYNHGGVGEVLSAVYPEGLVPLRDIDALADRLEAAIGGSVNPPAQNSHFLLETMQSATLALYQDLCSAKHNE